jgi:hypothetical protein
MFVTTSGRTGAPKAQRTATYDGTTINYNDPVHYVTMQNWRLVLVKFMMRYIFS